MLTILYHLTSLLLSTVCHTSAETAPDAPPPFTHRFTLSFQFIVFIVALVFKIRSISVRARSYRLLVRDPAVINHYCFPAFCTCCNINILTYLWCEVCWVSFSIVKLLLILSLVISLWVTRISEICNGEWVKTYLINTPFLPISIVYTR